MKRILSVMVILTLVLTGSLLSVKALDTKAANVAASDSFADYIDKDGNKYLLDPESNEYKRIVNTESEIARLTAINERDYEFERLFEERRTAERAAHKTIGNECQTRSITQPVPGGVGYGAFYTSSFQYDYVSGTRLSYDIICPSTAGGDLSSYLYLTGMNRAALGVEALVSYYLQNSLHFEVYDWAKPDGSRWVVNLSGSQLNNYLTTKYINGAYRQILTVQNITTQLSSTQWENVVLITNYSNDTFEQIYSYTYTATLADQQDDYMGSWAAIVETFQSAFNQDLNIMGFNLVYVMPKNTPYTVTTWGNWVLLTSSVSTIRNDNVGLTVVFNSPNYTFGVK